MLVRRLTNALQIDMIPVGQTRVFEYWEGGGKGRMSHDLRAEVL